MLRSVPVHDVTRSFRKRGCWSLACKMRFPPSVVEAQHGWALSTAPARSERSGEPEWSLRNEGCGDGLPCEAENEGRGKTRSKFVVVGRNGAQRMEAEILLKDH